MKRGTDEREWEKISDMFHPVIKSGPRERAGIIYALIRLSKIPKCLPQPCGSPSGHRFYSIAGHRGDK